MTRETRTLFWKTALTPDGAICYAEGWSGGVCHYEAVYNENYEEWHVRHCGGGEVYGVWRKTIEQVYAASEHHHEHKEWPQ